MQEEEEYSSRLSKATLTFLKKNKWLDVIQTTCESYANNNEQVLYPFVIDTNVMDLMQDESELCNLLLNNPLRFQDLLRKVIYMVIITSNWLPSLENMAQLLVTIGITTMPPFPEYQISCYQDLLNCAVYKNYQFHGIFVTLSAPSTFTLGTCYACPSTSCVGSKRYGPIATRLPGAQEYHIVRNDWKCIFCNLTMKENVKSRLLSERVIAGLVPIDSLDKEKRHRRQQPIPVYFSGEHIQGLKLGRSYVVTGLAVAKFDWPSSKVLEANYLKPVIDEEFCFKKRDLHILDLMKGKILDKLDHLVLPDAIMSPFHLPLILSYYFGENIVARGLYQRLKLGMLIELVTCGHMADSHNMSLLALGSDTAIINRLLNFGRHFAPRSTTLSSQRQLQVSVSRDNGECGSIGMEANPLLLANGGICYFGDVDKFSTACKKTIAGILETDAVAVESARDPCHANLLPKNLPFECQVWAYVSGTSQMRAKDPRIFQNSNSGDVPKQLLDTFSIVYYTDSWSPNENEQRDALVMDSTLASSMGLDVDGKMFTNEELITFLKIARRQKVNFDWEAETLIKNYYVASRRMRSSATDNTDISIAAITSLSQFAEAHARLSLRSSVVKEDAIAAILLHEEYLTSRYGTSCFNVRPCPHLLQRSERDDLKMMLEQYEEFASVLHKFVDTYGQEMSSQLDEEE